MRRLLALPVLLALAKPAAATEWVSCSAGAEGASVDVLVGLGLDVIAISAARIEAGGKKWATDAAGDQKIIVGQGFEDVDKMIVDFTDDGMSRIVASLRLFKASDGDSTATGGTLRVAGVGAWAVACSGP